MRVLDIILYETVIATFHMVMGIFIGWLVLYRPEIRDLRRKVKELEGPQGIEFTNKTYRAAYRRAMKISDQAMQDHIRALRGPDAALRWGRTAYLINLRHGRKVGAFWAFFVS